MEKKEKRKKKKREREARVKHRQTGKVYSPWVSSTYYSYKWTYGVKLYVSKTVPVWWPNGKCIRKTVRAKLLAE